MATDKLTTVDFAALQTDPGYMLELYFAELRKSHPPKNVGKAMHSAHFMCARALRRWMGPRWLRFRRVEHG
jgi:hypothetical protein